MKNKIRFLLIISCILSIISFFLCLFLGAMNGWFFLYSFLPLSFIFLIFSCKKIWYKIPSNIGVIILFFGEMIRLCISPALVVINGFVNVIDLNSSSNLIPSVLLMVYETLAISLAINVVGKINYNRYQNIDSKNANKRFGTIIFLFVALNILIIILAPEVFKSFRSILGVFTDKMYTTEETSFVVDANSTSFFKKLLLVSSNYLLKIFRLIVPAYLIFFFKKKFGKRGKILSLICVASPFLFVDGAIARSIYFSLLLFLMYNYIYGINLRKMFLPFGLAFSFVFIYFIARYFVSENSTSLMSYLTFKSVDYFSGANIVSGSFNLPNELSIKFKYLIGEFQRSLPFANTIFGLNASDTSQNFFNLMNDTNGCIPPTIGMGYYYLGFVFSPVFSMIFAKYLYIDGEKSTRSENPFYKLLYMYMSIIFALGIVMYNIEITLGTLVQSILPIYIMIRIAYRKVSVKNDSKSY